jgi:hypothetical protein
LQCNYALRQKQEKPLINPVITRAVGLAQRRDHMLPFSAQRFRDFLLLEANAG